MIKPFVNFFNDYIKLDYHELDDHNICHDYLAHDYCAHMYDCEDPALYYYLIDIEQAEDNGYVYNGK